MDHPDIVEYLSTLLDPKLKIYPLIYFLIYITINHFKNDVNFFFMDIH